MLTSSARPTSSCTERHPLPATGAMLSARTGSQGCLPAVTFTTPMAAAPKRTLPTSLSLAPNLRVSPPASATRFETCLPFSPNSPNTASNKVAWGSSSVAFDFEGLARVPRNSSSIASLPGPGSSSRPGPASANARGALARGAPDAVSSHDEGSSTSTPR